jgi:hypothetical protein
MKRKPRKQLRSKRIAANLHEQAPNNSYSPPTCYEDFTFSCADCGKTGTWTAEQQKQYYEEWKKPIYGTAKYCRECRRSRRVEKEAQRKKTEKGGSEFHELA